MFHAWKREKQTKSGTNIKLEYVYDFKSKITQALLQQLINQSSHSSQWPNQIRIKYSL